jgi:hypothetical protein
MQENVLLMSDLGCRIKINDSFLSVPKSQFRNPICIMFVRPLIAAFLDPSVCPGILSKTIELKKADTISQKPFFFIKPRFQQYEICIEMD